jgi:hypothetical protein
LEGSPKSLCKSSSSPSPHLRLLLLVLWPPLLPLLLPWLLL